MLMMLHVYVCSDNNQTYIKKELLRFETSNTKLNVIYWNVKQITIIRFEKYVWHLFMIEYGLFYSTSKW